MNETRSAAKMAAVAGAVLNVSAYRFVALPDAAALRDAFHVGAAGLALRGTVLLAEEGINLFLAGAPADVQAFLDDLQQDPRFAGLPVKRSWSEATPFRKLQVKVKREIIRMDQPTIRPQTARAPAVAPATLQRWLDRGHDDAGREVVLLDTRNAFEVEQGRFSGALHWSIDRFSAFPDAVLAHAEELAGKTVVTYCTGGIRCEKAALFMADAGIAHVFQLEGGILQHFEATGGAHFEGECFVFDERRALDVRLAAVPLTQAP